MAKNRYQCAKMQGYNLKLLKCFKGARNAPVPVLWSRGILRCRTQNYPPACPILSCSNLTSSHPSPHLASAGSFAHFWTREWNISILQRFFSCFSAVFSGRPPAGLTSVRTPRHAIPRTESEILSCKEEELTGGGMEPLTLISNFMQMII